MKKDDVRLKNLRPKPFKPGQSGNPKGRPPGIKDRGTILRRYLALQYKDKTGSAKPQPFSADGESMTVEEMIELSFIKKALMGSESAYKEIKDTLFGKNPDIITGDPLAPIHTSNTNTTIPELKGAALIEELKRRGLPTDMLEE